MSIEKEFIPYQQTLALKELGFDEPCFAYYGEINGGEIELFLKKEFNSETPYVLAPTFYQAFRWFREKGYDVKIQKESDGLYFGFYWTGAAWVIIGVGTYEEAELECLKKLIEIVKGL